MFCDSDFYALLKLDLLSFDFVEVISNNSAWSTPVRRGGLGCLGDVGNPELPDLLWLQGYAVLLVRCWLVLHLGKQLLVAFALPSELLVVSTDLLDGHVAGERHFLDLD